MVQELVEHPSLTFDIRLQNRSGTILVNVRYHLP